MGSAGSKAAGRSYKAVQAGAQASAIAEYQLSGSVAVDAARGRLLGPGFLQGGSRSQALGIPNAWLCALQRPSKHTDQA